MTEPLPLLFICWDVAGAYSPGRSSADSAPVLESKAQAVAAAWRLGWIPVEPPVVSPLDLPGPGGGESAHRRRCVDSLLLACDALYVVGEKATDEMRREVDEFWRLGRPMFATHAASTFPEKRTLTGPPWAAWADAAEKRTVEGWVCKGCKRFWGDDERLARWCCAKEIPCDRCGALKPKKDPYVNCAPCQAVRDAERHARRKRSVWNGLMLWSDDEDEWFHDLDDAESKAAERFTDREGRAPTDAELDAELEAMRLLLSEPVTGRPFDALDHLHDQLPDDPDERRITAGLEDAVRALNEAIAAMGPLSYEYTDVALDLEATRRQAATEAKA